MAPRDAIAKQARRAYERGRLRHAIVRSWPVVLIAATGVMLGDGRAAFGLAIPLWALSVWALFEGKHFPAVVANSWRAGLVPMLVALAVWNEQGCCGPCPPICAPICSLAGIAVGSWLGIRCSRRASSATIVMAFAIAGLTASLGCAALGVATIGAALIGLLLGLAPVWVLRRAAA